jgi:hypothetical protein
LDAQGQAASDLRERLTAMLGFLEMLTSLYEQIAKLPTGSVRTMLGGQGRLGTVLAGGELFKPAGPPKPAPSKPTESSKPVQPSKPGEPSTAAEEPKAAKPPRSAEPSKSPEAPK